MKKILRATIVCLLIPSLVFAQIPQNRANETTIKQTDLARIWNALNTEVGQQIVSSIETTVGSINLEQAKAFTSAEGEIAFVPVKSFGKVLAALCYRHLEDGSEYLYLITYNAAEKGVSFTFPSGRTFIMSSSGTKESFNPDFQFQQYDDLDNTVGITGQYLLRLIITRICSPGLTVAALVGLIAYIFCYGNRNCDVISASIMLSVPFLFLVPAYLFENRNLEMISIFLALYYYGCIFANFAIVI
jgi:hypothetical protein